MRNELENIIITHRGTTGVYSCGKRVIRHLIVTEIHTDERCLHQLRY